MDSERQKEGSVGSMVNLTSISIQFRKNLKCSVLFSVGVEVDKSLQQRVFVSEEYIYFRETGGGLS